MQRSKIKDIFVQEQAGGDVLVQGWVKTRRSSKSVTFLQITDGSTLQDLQIVVDEDNPGHEAAAGLTTGCSVSVEGVLVESRGQGQKYEVQAKTLTVLGGSDPETYPLQKKRHSPEFLREIAHLRPRTNTFGAMARVRNSMAYAIHSFYQDRGFQFIQTPIITASDAEGAGSMFRVTTLDLNDLPKNGGMVNDEEDFFGKPAFLTVSGQLEAEIFALALSDVYTFGPTFRAENSNTSRHLAEFWMVEPEVAFCQLDGLAELAEDFLKHLCGHVLENCQEDMEFFNKWHDNDKVILMRHDEDLSLPAAYNLARIEGDLGTKATYFVRLHAKNYNLLSQESYSSVHKIIKMGHEIGIHYELHTHPTLLPREEKIFVHSKRYSQFGRTPYKIIPSITILETLSVFSADRCLRTLENSGNSSRMVLNFIWSSIYTSQ